MRGRFAGASADEVVTALGLEPLVAEGGYWAAGPRTPGLGAITALLTDAADGFSAMHRLTIDEGWQWLDGDPAMLLLLRADGSGRQTRLGPHEPVVVPRGDWQGATTLGRWTLVACWCSPAFVWEHFTLGERAALERDYPRWRAEITALTRAGVPR